MRRFHNQLMALLLALAGLPVAAEELPDLNVENLFGEWLRHCEYKDNTLELYAMENLSQQDLQRWMRNEGFDAEWRADTEDRLLRERQAHRDRYLSLTRPKYREIEVYTLGDYDPGLGGFISPEGWTLARFGTYVGTPREFKGHIQAGVSILYLPFSFRTAARNGMAHAPHEATVVDFFPAKSLWPESMPRVPGGPGVVIPMSPELAREIAEDRRNPRRVAIKYEARIVGCSPERWPIVQRSNMTMHIFEGRNWRGYPKAGRQLAHWP